MQEATIAIEDKSFYQEPGFPLPASFARHILHSLRIRYRAVRPSPSNLSNPRSLRRNRVSREKIKEIILAFWAERIYSKNQILEMYLNQVPYGGTAWGIEAAAQTYFGKSAKDLNLAEAALLAGLPAAPSEYSPFGDHPEKAFERQKEVLRRMTEDKYITPAEETVAPCHPIHLAQMDTAIRAPHFVMYVKDLLEQKYGARLVEQGGLRITTSLDLSIEQNTEAIVKQQVESLAN